MTFRTLAITLSKKPFREAERLYSFYTLSAGKVNALCQGARKIVSKLSAHLEPFGVTDIMVASGKQIDRVAGASSVKYFSGIAASAEKAAAAGGLLSFVDALTKPGVAENRIFFHLADFLEWLEAAPLADFRARETAFLTASYLKLIHFLGYAPDMDKCVYCRRPLTPAGEPVAEAGVVFEAHRGGFFCGECAARVVGAEATPAPASVISYLRVLRSANLTELARAAVPPHTIVQGGRRVLAAHIAAHLDLKPSAARFFR